MEILNKKGQRINVSDQVAKKLIEKGICSAIEEKKEVKQKKTKKNEKID